MLYSAATTLDPNQVGVQTGGPTHSFCCQELSALDTGLARRGPGRATRGPLLGAAQRQDEIRASSRHGLMGPHRQPLVRRNP